MNLDLPDRVSSIIEELKRHDYEAYAVGGCVRDALLGIEPNDWDITTSATPIEIKSIFLKTVDTGIKHGTVTIMYNNVGYEVTTYRIDGDYVDNRHPETVTFTKNLYEDLKRRDFTINAMAYNDEEGLIDIYGGKEDLKNKIIRCVGVPDDRFNEDSLRMLRAIRFSAQLNFDIDPETYKSIKKNAALIKNVSVERIREELTKILMSDSPEKFMLLYDTGMLEYIMPEFIPNINCAQNSPWHKYTVDEHIIRTVISIEKKPDLRWTMLLHDIGKAYAKTTDEKGIDHFAKHPEISAEIAEDILDRYNFDTKTKRKILKLIRYHDIDMSVDEVNLRKTIAAVGEDIFDELLDVMNADDSAKAEVVWIENKEKNDAIKSEFDMFKMKKQCLSRNKLKFTGDDLMDLGYKEGAEIGVTLEYLFEKVLENPNLNDEEDLRRLAKEYKSTLRDDKALKYESHIEVDTDKSKDEENVIRFVD